MKQMLNIAAAALLSAATACSSEVSAPEQAEESGQATTTTSLVAGPNVLRGQVLGSTYTREGEVLTPIPGVTLRISILSRTVTPGADTSGVPFVPAMVGTVVSDPDGRFSVVGVPEGRFALEATLADSPWLAAQTRDLPPDVSPWSLPAVPSSKPSYK